MKHIRTVLFEDLPRQLQAHENRVLRVARIIGFFALVERLKDTYENYHFTHIRTLHDRYLAPRQRKLLQADTNFHLGHPYVGTAVQLQPDNTIKTRAFFLNQNHVGQLGFAFPLQRPLGDGNSVITHQAHTIETLGQIIKYIPNCFPRAQKLTPQGLKEQIELINALLPAYPKEPGMEWKRQSGLRL